MKAKRGNIILIAIALLVANCYTVKPSLQEETFKSFICERGSCGLCHTFINDGGSYNKLIYRALQYERKGQKENGEKYCCSSISNDHLYQFKTFPDPIVGCVYEFLITDKDIIFDFLFPFFQDSIRREITYSYSENRDTVFENLIEYDHKVIINDDLYYYPLRDTTLRYARLSTLHLYQLDEFIELLKKRNYFKEECLIDPKSISSISIYIPLVDSQIEP